MTNIQELTITNYLAAYAGANPTLPKPSVTYNSGWYNVNGTKMRQTEMQTAIGRLNNRIHELANPTTKKVVVQWTGTYETVMEVPIAATKEEVDELVTEIKTDVPGSKMLDWDVESITPGNK